MQTTGRDQNEALVAPEAVRAQLSRILTSADFNVPARLRSFLTFVVEEVLAGRGERIKAYTIATRVFERSGDFDSINDPVVRIEAGRLRRALERYYLLSGRDDSVVIVIPKGTYTPAIQVLTPRIPEADKAELAATADHQPTSAPLSPRFKQWRQAGADTVGLVAGLVIFSMLVAGAALLGRPDARQKASNPEVAVVVSPFANLSGAAGELYSDGISDDLLGQLARFKELRVIGRAALRLSQTDAASTAHEVRYVLEGSVRVAGQRIRVVARLLDGQTLQIVWAGSYDRDLTGSDTIAIESEIAGQVARAVAQSYGAVFRPAAFEGSARVAPAAEAYRCVLRFYLYRKAFSREEHAATRECLEQTTARYPEYSTGWAMLAYLYLDEDRFGFNRRAVAASGRARALDAAQRSVSLDPDNVRGLQALSTALFFNGEPAEALRVGEKALALNPNDSELLAELGGRIAVAGNWRRGAAMMEDALARNPAQASFYGGLLAAAYYMIGDDNRALWWIKRSDLKQLSLYHFISALIFARAGHEAEAKASVAEFQRMRPRFFDNLRAELAVWNFTEKDRLVLIEGAKRAGFTFEASAL